MSERTDGVFYTTIGLFMDREEALEWPLQVNPVADQRLRADDDLERAVSYDMLAAVGVAQGN